MLFLRKFSAFLTVSLVILGGGLFLNSPRNKNASPQEFIIAPGQNLDQITLKLEEAGLIRSRYFLKASLIFTGSAKKVQAGYFSLSAASSSIEIAKSLTRAQQKQMTIAIPEGLRREEIAFLLSKSLPKETFSPAEFIAQTKGLEGRLFPDTYAFNKDTTAEEAISALKTRFRQIISSLNIPSDQLDQVVILASLIEREAAEDKERPVIAGILNNRLKNGWPLQIDASVQYALAENCAKPDCDWWPRPLTFSNLKLNSPYNTYKYPGLPAGPISNPGLQSLKAAANPRPTGYWFYLHDGKGQIHFAKTSQEHAQNICKYLKKNCSE